MPPAPGVFNYCAQEIKQVCYYLFGVGIGFRVLYKAVPGRRARRQRTARWGSGLSPLPAGAALHRDGAKLGPHLAVWGQGAAFGVRAERLLAMGCDRGAGGRRMLASPAPTGCPCPPLAVPSCALLPSSRSPPPARRAPRGALGMLCELQLK